MPILFSFLTIELVFSVTCRQRYITDHSTIKTFGFIFSCCNEELSGEDML